jgi:hypothetical protein
MSSAGEPSKMTDSRIDEQRRANVTLLKKLGVVVVFMFGLATPGAVLRKICDAAGLRNIAADVLVNTQSMTRAVRIGSTQCVRHGLTFRRSSFVSVHRASPPGLTQDQPYRAALTGQAIPNGRLRRAVSRKME